MRKDEQLKSAVLNSERPVQSFRRQHQIIATDLGLKLALENALASLLSSV